MRWSWKIGEIAGIGIYIHATFWLLILFILYDFWSQGHNLVRAIAGVVFVMVIFGCIVLHELGHALTARHYAIRTSDITLLPIGGLARLEKMPQRFDVLPVDAAAVKDYIEARASASESS